MTVTEAFEYIKSPVEGRYPTKPDAYVSVYRAMQSGIIPAVGNAVFTYAMPSDSSKGYCYVDPAHCRAMTDGEKEEFARICEERKRAGSKKESKPAPLPVAKKKPADPMYPDFEDIAGKKIVCFDTETTGIGKDDEILQLTICGFDENGEAEVLLNELFKPTHHTSWPDAQRVNGISPQMVKNCPTFAERLSEIKRFFADADVIVGYNVKFDARLVEQSSCRLYSVPKDKLCDPMLYYKDKKKEKGHTLTDACAQYIPERLAWFKENAHDAASDSLITLEVLKAMGLKEGVDITAGTKEKDRC